MSEQSTKLQRTVALPQAVALYFGAIVGAGVLVLPGLAARVAGVGSLWAWIFASVLGLPLAFTFSALAARIPDAGGMYTYVARAFNAGWGTIAGWFYFFAAATGQVIVPLTGAYYVAGAFHLGRPETFLVAGAILSAATYFNLLGLRLSAAVQLMLSGGVALILLATTAVALPHVEWRRIDLLPVHISSIGRAVVLIFFAFSGWEAIAPLTEEFHDPRRDVPRATLLTVGLITLIYLGIALAVVGTGSYDSANVANTAVMRVLATSTGLPLAPLMASVAVLICLGTTNAFVAGASRLGYGLARAGAFPVHLKRLNQGSVPSAAVWSVGAYAGVGLVLAYTLGWDVTPFLRIADALVLGTYVLVMGAGFRVLTGRQRWLAGIGFILYALTLPFAGTSLLVPLALGGGALVFSARNRRQRSGS